jgi:hypothetical protein
MEGIQPIGFPFFIQELWLVCYVERQSQDPSSIQTTIEIKIEDDLIVSQPMDLNFSDKLGTRLVTSIQGMALSKPGALSFNLKFGQETLGSWAIRIEGPNKPQLELRTS